MEFRTQCNVFPFKFFPQYFPILFTFAYTKIYSLVHFLEPLCAWNSLHQVLHTKQSYSLASNNSRKSNPFLFHFRTYYCKLFRILLVKAKSRITMIGSFKIGAIRFKKRYNNNMKFDFILVSPFLIIFVMKHSFHNFMITIFIQSSLRKN